MEKFTMNLLLFGMKEYIQIFQYDLVHMPVYSSHEWRIDPIPVHNAATHQPE